MSAQTKHQIATAAEDQDADPSPLLSRIMDEMNAIAARQSRVSPVRLRSFEEVERYAERAARSGIVPKDFVNKADAIIIAVMAGAELGLTPMQSLLSIAIINGRPALWGDALLGLCRRSPLCEDVIETLDGSGDDLTAICTVKRRGATAVVGRFSVADAKKARLWGKKGYNGQDTPWITYPERMLQMRARGFALRDAFPDILKGLYSAEEAMDIPTEPSRPAPPAASKPRPRAELTPQRERTAAEYIGDDIPAFDEEPSAPPPQKGTGQNSPGIPDDPGRLRDRVDAAIQAFAGAEHAKQLEKFENNCQGLMRDLDEIGLGEVKRMLVDAIAAAHERVRA